jgi:stage II sporulation protein P
MIKKAFGNLFFVIVALILVVLILNQASSVIEKIQQNRNIDTFNETEYPNRQDMQATVTKPIDEVSETEHGEDNKRFGDDIYASFFSPKKLLSYQLPFLTQLDIQANIGVEKSIFKQKDDIKTKTSKAGEAPLFLTLKGDGPNFLIYHTHTSESYRKSETSNYQETTRWRTDDARYNVVGLGSLLKDMLEDDYGYKVLHDKTDHEPPKLSTAYSRSVLTMQDYKDQYDDLKVYIDIHRDAANVKTDTDDVVVIDEKRCARVMFVVGTGTNFNEKPVWENNYKLALALSNGLNEIKEGFAKPIRVKDGRYNQHISDACILIEIGHNANTYEEAKNAVEHIAKVIDGVVESAP